MAHVNRPTPPTIQQVETTSSTDDPSPYHQVEDIVIRATLPSSFDASSTPEQWAAALHLLFLQSDVCQAALRLLANRFQSPCEREATLALQLLHQLTVKAAAGSVFLQEIGKFRFINELIRIISPKYLADRTPPLVKTRAIELLYSWTILSQSDASKAKEAYEMLRRQGVIKADPAPAIKPPPPTPRKKTIFDDPSKARALRKLLQSSHSDDVDSANRMIQSMLKEDDRRQENISRRQTQLQVANNNAQLLSELLKENGERVSGSEELAIMRQLAESCLRLRPQVCKLAAEVAALDDDAEDGSENPTLDEILRASDRLTEVVNDYRRAIGLVAAESSSLVEIDAAMGMKKEGDKLVDFDLLGDDRQAESNALAIALQEPSTTRAAVAPSTEPTVAELLKAVEPDSKVPETVNELGDLSSVDNDDDPFGLSGPLASMGIGGHGQAAAAARPMSSTSAPKKTITLEELQRQLEL